MGERGLQGLPGTQGPPGEIGPEGPMGPSCRIVSMQDGKKIRQALSCPDGSLTFLPKGGGLSTGAKIAIGAGVATGGTAVVLCVFLKKCGKVPRLGPVVTTLPIRQ
jgi:hypothetical protein